MQIGKSAKTWLEPVLLCRIGNHYRMWLLSAWHKPSETYRYIASCRSRSFMPKRIIFTDYMPPLWRNLEITKNTLLIPAEEEKFLWAYWIGCRIYYGAIKNNASWSEVLFERALQFRKPKDGSSPDNQKAIPIFTLCAEELGDDIAQLYLGAAIFWESVYRKIPGKHSNISRHQSNDKMQMP